MPHVKGWAKGQNGISIDRHCKNFNSSILSCHTVVSCVTIQNYVVEIFTMGVNGDSISPYLLQWAMIYSFGINTDFANRS